MTVSATTISTSESEAVPPLHFDTVRQIPALTSCRFFAASMIFLLHLSQMFGFSEESGLGSLALAQGVSFFFVLSGFILTLVHPDISTGTQANQFMVARFARVWPTHLFAFLLTVLFVPPVLAISHTALVAIANLTMIQAWFFVPSITASFNASSWSISVEWFFYLLFPFLIKDRLSAIKWRWILTSLIGFACVGLYAFLCTRGGHVSSGIYIVENPFVRLLEFTLGMVTCHLFQKYGLPNSISKNQATFLELFSLVLIFAAVNIRNLWSGPTYPNLEWAVHTAAIPLCGAPFFAIFIFLLASERGRLARMLDNGVLIKLGELSYALYMMHLLVLNVVSQYQNHFVNLPPFVLPIVATVLCLLSAGLSHELVEIPSRRLILKSFSKLIYGENRIGLTDCWKNLFTGRDGYRIVTMCIAFGALASWVQLQFKYISNESANSLVAHAIPSSRNIDFGNRFKLLGMKVSKKANGVHLNSVWQSLRQQQLSCGCIISAISGSGMKVSSTMLPQDNFARQIDTNELFEDTMHIPSKSLMDAKILTVSLFDPIAGKSLPIAQSNQGGERTELSLAMP